MRTRTAESRGEREESNKNLRMSLHVLQPAATDKENLVGPGRKLSAAVERNKINIENEKNMNENLVKNIIKKKKVGKSSAGESSKKAITTKDLIDEEPSEAYWKQLAETRRKALEEALGENEVLSNRIEVLEQEKALMQEMLDEARNVIEVLNEIIDENGETSNAAADDSECASSNDDENTS